VGLTITSGSLAFANVPPAEPQGCHGAATVEYKQLTEDAGGQGSAIGGRGNSDGDADNGQAHSAAGRGATLQAFLAAECEVGSQAD
jgi:hypothetical protein